MSRIFAFFSNPKGMLLILLGIIFLNPWIWRIIKEDLIIAIFLIMLTISFFYIIESRKLRKLIFLITVFLFLILSHLSLKLGFDKGLTSLTPEEEVQLNQRHKYYSQELGPIFLNSKVLNYYKNYNSMIYKFSRNLYSNLDLNLYFFASHPRERSSVQEFEKYPPLLIGFFIIGVLLLIYKGSVFSFIYVTLAAIISAFIDPNYVLGPILFFPLVTICIVLGIFFSFIFLQKSLKYNEL